MLKIRKKWMIIFVFVWVGTGFLVPQSSLAGPEKLDSALRSMLGSADFQVRETQIQSTEDENIVDAFVKVKGTIRRVKALGVDLRVKAGDVYTARIPVNALSRLSDLKEVVRVEKAKPVHLLLDRSVSRIRADQVWERMVDKHGLPITGKGVVVGIIDSGVDIHHETFKGQNGQTRLAYVWDTTDSRGPHACSVKPDGQEFCSGTECTSEDIQNNRCLQVDDFLGHGTHALGIAAGRGRASGAYAGVAPDADLIVVKMGFRTGQVVLETDIIAGVNYIFQRAGELGKPAVVNMSLGGSVGPRDGTSLMETSLDKLCERSGPTDPARIIVVSAGNSGIDPYHASVLLHEDMGPDNGQSILFEIPSYEYWSDGGQVRIEGWYFAGEPGKDLVSIELYSNEDDESFPARDSGVQVGAAWAEAPWPGNFGTIEIDNRWEYEENGRLTRGFAVTIRESDFPVSRIQVDGKWSLRLRAREFSARVIEVDLWINEQDQIGGGEESGPPFFTHPDYTSTLNTPCTADKVICVGAYDNKCEWKDIDGNSWTWVAPFDRCSPGAYTLFSSIGPRRDGVRKPDVLAPGLGVASALSGDMSELDIAFSHVVAEGYVIMSGTSMSAPHVAGVVALMLQQNPTLSVEEVRQNLIASTGRSYWDEKTGWGKVDAVRAVQGGAGGSGGDSRTGLGEEDDTCFIATAVFGDIDAPQVERLRALRDKSLLRTSLGRGFVRSYYRWSPPVAAWLKEHTTLSKMVRLSLMPMVGISEMAYHRGSVKGLALYLFGLFLLSAVCYSSLKRRIR